MLQLLGAFLFGVAWLGLLLLLAQAGYLFFWSRPHRVDGFTPSISILKPLCGADDWLEDNLERFASLAYVGDYELLLGVRSVRDEAFPVAQRVAARHPHVRVVLQRGEPGFNPKVNQLITLAQAARHDLFVISDSNVRVRPTYLVDVAAPFRDPGVGCVSHPVAGLGERTLGSAMDNLHATLTVGAGVVVAKQLTGRSLVIGKSMALWREDVERLGGFFAFKDVLAEDHVVGTQVEQLLKKRVVISSESVFNVSVRRSVADFVRRYARWSVIQRTAVGPWTYAGQLLLNPVPVVLLAALLAPRHPSWLLLAVVLGKPWLDVVTAAQMGSKFRFGCLPASWLKDLLIAGCWLHGLFSRTVTWRGTRLRVAQGSLLVPLAPPAYDAPAKEGRLAPAE